MLTGSTADVAAGVARSCAAASKAVQKATKVALRESGTVARKELTDTAKQSAGGDRRYSNFKGPALGVKLRQAPGVLTVAPVGPWKIAEEGADPHTMPAWGRGRAQHPGTRGTQGKRLWTKGREATYRKLERQVPDEVGRAVEGAFQSG